MQAVGPPSPSTRRMTQGLKKRPAPSSICQCHPLRLRQRARTKSQRSSIFFFQLRPVHQETPQPTGKSSLGRVLRAIYGIIVRRAFLYKLSILILSASRSQFGCPGKAGTENLSESDQKLLNRPPPFFRLNFRLNDVQPNP